METKNFGLERLAELTEQVMKEAAERCEQMNRDYDAGKRDCQFGIYDKWYRYHHKDDGAAYDAGWVYQNQITKNEKVTFLDA